MILLRKEFGEKEEKKGLSPEDKKKLATRGLEAGLTATGLAGVGYGTAKLGEYLNTMKPRPEVVEKRISKIVEKRIKKMKPDPAELETVRNRLMDKAYEGLNNKGVSEKSIKNAKRASKYLAAVGIPLAAYSLYARKKAKNDINKEK